MPSDPCPPADDPEAILVWIWQQHVRTGRIQRHGEHRDPFWRLVQEKQTDRQRLLDEITASEDLSARIEQLARLFKLDIAGLTRDEQIASVVRACVPLRFQIGAELKHLGQEQRAAEVLRSKY